MITTSEDHAMHIPTKDLAEVEAFLAHLRTNGYPATTIATYASPLRRAAVELPHGLMAEPEEIQAWLGRPGLARNTRASYQRALRSFYRWAIGTGRLIGANPMDGVPVISTRRGLPRPVPPDQLQILLTKARQPYRLWALIAAYAGLRCVEVARLERDDITEQAIYVLGKGDKPGVVPTHPELWEATRALPRGLICEGATPKRVSANINRQCDRLGLADVTAHRLRHTAGTIWQRATGDVRVTQQLLRHASPTTTAVYTAVSDEAMRAAVMAMPTLNGSIGVDADRG